MKIEGYSINMEWKHMRPLLTRNFYAVSAASVFGDLYGTHSKVNKEVFQETRGQN
jgi:hypothetical protein